MKGSEDVLIFEYNPEAGKHIIDEVDLIFLLDYNIPKRSGKWPQHVQNARAKRILIDHHPYPKKACDVVISHPKKSSTSELIFRLIDQLGEYESMNHATAECIYCGMNDRIQEVLPTTQTILKFLR
jgi:phosphoesterase RecJ-like protein